MSKAKLVLILVVLFLLVLSETTVLADDSGSDNATVQLEVTIVAPVSGTSGGGGAALFPIGTNLFGTEKTYYSEYYGDIFQTIRGTSPDGNLSVTIPKYTVALDSDGKRLSDLDVTINDEPHAPLAGTNIIGLPYDFKPNGATFTPPITLTWTYDPDDLPASVLEDDLTLAFYDDGTGEWVELECTVDTETNTITASVSHFTTFAILGRTPIVQGPPPTAPELPAEPLKPSVTPVTPIAPVEPPPVPVVPSPPPTSVPAPMSTLTVLFNWLPFVGSILSGVVVGLLLYFFWWRRR